MLSGKPVSGLGFRFLRFEVSPGVGIKGLGSKVKVYDLRLQVYEV